MKREDVLGFVGTIIRNGVENNIDSDTVRDSIVNYAKYLELQKFADESTINIINDLANCSKELLSLSRTMSKNEIDILSLVKEVLPQNSHSNNQLDSVDTVGSFVNNQSRDSYSYEPVIGSCFKPAHSFSCGSSRPVLDPCSSLRSVGYSSCGSSYDSYSNVSSCSSGRSLGGRSC